MRRTRVPRPEQGKDQYRYTLGLWQAVNELQSQEDAASLRVDIDELREDVDALRDDVDATQEYTITQNAGVFFFDAAGAAMSAASGALSVTAAGTAILIDFPGPVGALITRVRLYGSNPGASVRGCTNTVRTAADQYYGSDTQIATDTPTTSISTQWTSDFSGLSITATDAGRVFVRSLSAAGVGTSYSLFTVQWTFRISPADFRV
jgi:hypothetical protein